MGSLSRVLSEAYVAVKAITRYRGVLFWAVVFPLLFYGLIVAIWGSPAPEPVDLGVVELDEGVVLGGGSRLDLGEVLVSVLNESGIYRVHVYGSVGELEEAVRDARVPVGLVVPEGFTRNLTSVEPATLRVLVVGGQWRGYYTAPLEGVIEGFSRNLSERVINESLGYALEYVPPNATEYVIRFYEFVLEPVRVEEDVYTPPLLATPGGIRAYYGLSIMGIEILFMGLSMGVFAIIDMKREGTLRVVLASPMRPWEMLASQTLAALFYAAVSSLAVFAFSLLLGAEYRLGAGEALVVILLLAASALFTIGFGLLLAPLARSQEAATALVNMVAFPVMFIGGLTVPTFLLPEPLQAFAHAYPLTRMIDAARTMVTYGRSPGWALDYSLPALAATLLVYLLGALVYHRLLARAVEE